MPLMQVIIHPRVSFPRGILAAARQMYGDLYSDGFPGPVCARSSTQTNMRIVAACAEETSEVSVMESVMESVMKSVMIRS